MRHVIPGLFVVVFVACTGGAGPIDQTGNGSSSGSSGITSSGGGSSSGEATGGGGSSSGGTSTTTVQASEFDQACVESTDCIAVYEGAICDACKCPNAAIAKSAIAEYGTRFQSADCPTTDQACAADCAEATPSCAQGTCTITR